MYRRFEKYSILLIIAVFCLIITGCGVFSRSRMPEISKPQTGKASWYGLKYHGRMCASGEIYDMYKLTAAHRYLPFNTYIRVTNLQNGKKVTVRINDRGPFIRGRVIDLSYAAAQKIDIVECGTADVKLEIITR
ncbi:septal ring lytic transglycosylase RlpA family protein [Candidatus Poribacteria bacterium]|nr:septal ring lytic transglycosylase RlpA family protein [Candidatus Poribacteria bacterium]